jgi:hypothetical protein
MTCHEGSSRGTPVLCLNPAAGWEGVVGAMCWQLYPHPLLEAGWAPGPVWTGFTKTNTRCPPLGIKSRTIQPIAIHYGLCSPGSENSVLRGMFG